MSNVDNLMLEHLKRFQATLERVEAKQDEAIRRIGAVEHDLAGLQLHMVNVHLSVDTLGKRTDRVENRLEISG